MGVLLKETIREIPAENKFSNVEEVISFLKDAFKDGL